MLNLRADDNSSVQEKKMLSMNRLSAIDVWCHYLQIGSELEQWPFCVQFPLPLSMLHVVLIMQLAIRPRIFISIFYVLM